MTKANVFLLGVLIVIYIFLSAWTQININPQFPSDIDIYLQAGQKALRHTNPYYPFKIGESFIYTPIALLIFTPLSFLIDARALWATLNIMSLGIMVMLLLYITKSRLRNYQVVFLTLGSLLFAPFLEQITIGQINSLVLLGIVLFLLGMARPKFCWIGDFCLAMAISIKMSPIILIALPLISLDRSRILRIISSLILLIGGSILFFGIGPWKNFFEILPLLFHWDAGTINESLAPTINMIMQLYQPNMDLLWINNFLSFLLLTLWFVAIIFTRKRGINPIATLCFGITTMTISSTLIWYHHLVFLLVPCIYLALSLNTTSKFDRCIKLLLLIGMVSVNASRLIETRVGIPLAAILGYLSIYMASGLSLHSSSFGRAAQPAAAGDLAKAQRENIEK